MTKLVQAVKEMIERDFNMELWQQLIDEQEKQRLMFEKKIEERSKVIAEKVLLKLKVELNQLKGHQ
jgi:uncharacterized protein (UPF0276 family)